MARPNDPFARLGPAARQYACDLYEEHLDEASFLYERWLNSYEDPACPWEELVHVGQRLDRHVTALVAGGEVAVELCHARCPAATAGEHGDVYAAVRVYGCTDRFDLFCELTGAAAPWEDERALAVEDALVRDAPAHWAGKLGGMLTQADGPLAPAPLARAIVRAIGRRRMAAGAAIHRALDAGVDDPEPYVWALSRLHETGAAPLLLRFAQTGKPSAVRAAFLSAIHLGIEPAVAHLRQAARHEIWPAVPLAVYGGPEVLPLLTGMARPGRLCSDVLLAFGLFGAPETVETLLTALNGALAEHAAAALYLVTGAEITEDVTLEPLRAAGEASTVGDGGDIDSENEATVIRRLSRALQPWQRFWAENESRFERGHRYRFGRSWDTACTPQSLLPRLRWLPREIRQVVADGNPAPVAAAPAYSGPTAAAVELAAATERGRG